MPCDSRHMERTWQEAESQNLFMRLKYAMEATGKQVSALVNNSIGYYGNIQASDEAARHLCSICKSLQGEELQRVIYDGRNPEARKLADWWENHQEVDRAKAEREADEQRKADLKSKALAKLTDEERKALLGN